MYLHKQFCRTCQTEKPATDFYKTSPRKCKVCHNAYRKEWVSKNLDKVHYQGKVGRLKRAYGLTKDEYDKLSENQQHLCAICNNPDTRLLSVDHCHLTGKVRGLLCRKCNIAIGNFEDQIERLESAIEYLKKHMGD